MTFWLYACIYLCIYLRLLRPPGRESEFLNIPKNTDRSVDQRGGSAGGNVSSRNNVLQIRHKTCNCTYILQPYQNRFGHSATLDCYTNRAI